jgi:hypothetical protein
VFQVLAGRVAALEGRLQGVDNLAGRAAAQDAIAEQLGIAVPSFDVATTEGVAAAITPGGGSISAASVVSRFKSAVEEARRRAKEGVLARLQRDAVELRDENTAIRQCASPADMDGAVGAARFATYCRASL